MSLSPVLYEFISVERERPLTLGLYIEERRGAWNLHVPIGIQFRWEMPTWKCYMTWLETPRGFGRDDLYIFVPPVMLKTGNITHSNILPSHWKRGEKNACLLFGVEWDTGNVSKIELFGRWLAQVMMKRTATFEYMACADKFQGKKWKFKTLGPCIWRVGRWGGVCFYIQILTYSQVV